MPFTEDIQHRNVIGRERRMGVVDILRQQIAGRFGPIPEWVVKKVAGRDIA